MIRLGVLSDSHGALSRVESAALALADCAYIVHLGDHAQDAGALSALTRAKIIAISGNCDWFSDAPNEALFDAGGARVLAVHGHRENVKNGLIHLSLKAEYAGAQLALYGHTHIANVENDGTRVFVNPGALKDGRYAVIEIDGGVIRPFLKRLD